MITKDIAAKIWHCYTEIEQGEKMLQEMKDRLDQDGNLDLTDTWGNRRDSLQLHIPGRSSGSFHIKHVSADVALTVIQKHIEQQRTELERLKGVCKIQLA
jgi:hypothetical protein